MQCGPHVMRNSLGTTCRHRLLCDISTTHLSIGKPPDLCRTSRIPHRGPSPQAITAAGAEARCPALGGSSRAQGGRPPTWRCRQVGRQLCWRWKPASTNRSLTCPRLCLPQVEGQLVPIIPLSALHHIQLHFCLRGTAADHAAGAAAAVAHLACSCSYVCCVAQNGLAWTWGRTCRDRRNLPHVHMHLLRVHMLPLHAGQAALDAGHLLPLQQDLHHAAEGSSLTAPERCQLAVPELTDLQHAWFQLRGRGGGQGSC